MGAPRGVLCLVALATLAAACGSSSSNGTAGLRSEDVAVVGQTHITKAQLRHQVALEVRAMRLGQESCTGGSEGQEDCSDKKEPVPATDTPEYRTTVVDPVINYLVTDAQLHDIARQLGVVVTKAQIQAQVTAQIQQIYGGNMTKYRADLTRFHLTDADVDEQVEFTLVERGIDGKLRRQVHVTPAEVQAYFQAHRNLYETDTATRLVDYVLEPSRAAAKRARARLAAGRSFAEVAGGAIDSSARHEPFVATAGQLEKNFQKAAFSLRTNALSALVPVDRRYMRSLLKGKCKPACFFVIRPTAATIKGGTEKPFGEVQAQIKTQLLSLLRLRHVQAVIAVYEKQQDAKTRYAAGYKPAPVTTPSTGVPDSDDETAPTS
jgi:PPIC-type PPIASE domain/SurA-like N-terminal domain